MRKRKLPPLICCQLAKCPLGQRALRFEWSGRYSGWTGYEEFGVITSYRYFGWAVTCSATVMAEAYDNGNETPCFDHFNDAVTALFCFMDLAEDMGEFQRIRRSLGVNRGQRVPYYNADLQPGVFWRCGLDMIRPDFDTDSRAMWSPARQRHFRQRHGETYDPKKLQWFAPPPIMGWHR
jgi:hypothetical protein